jgi:hypothetical protein
VAVGDADMDLDARAEAVREFVPDPDRDMRALTDPVTDALLDGLEDTDLV